MQSYKEKKDKRKLESQLIESTYIIYTPKIIKFVYKGQQKKLNQKAYLDNQMRFATLNSQQINRSFAKKLVQSTHSKKSQRVGKIQLISTKKPIIHLKSKCNSKRTKTEHFGLESSQRKKQSSHLQFPQHKNHISTTNFVQSFGCNFFSECNDNSYVDFGQRMPFSFDQSRKTIQKSQKSKTQAKIDGISIKKQEEISEKDGKSLYDFRKRKSIFAQQNLNKTFDLGSKQKNRSRSRKSIFEQRYKLCDLSFSKDRSTSTRKKIFDVFGQQKSRITVKSHEQQLQQCEIPKSVYKEWQKFSPQSESKEQFQNNGILEIVQQLKMQQSQVKQID